MKRTEVSRTLAGAKSHLSEVETDLTNIRVISKMLSEIRQTDQLLKFVVRSLVEKLEYHRALIVCKKEGTGLFVQEGVGFSSCTIEKFQHQGEAFFNKVMEQNQTLLFLPESSQRKELESLLGCTSLIAAPIRGEWVLLVGKNLPNDPLTKEDVELISTLITQVSIGLENIELYETLRKGKEQLEQTKANVENHAKMAIRANLELTQKEERLSRKISGFSILYSMGELIGRTHETKELLKLVAESLVLRLDYDRSLILKCNSSGVLIEAQVGFSGEEIEKIENQVLPFLSKVTTQGKAILLKSQTGYQEVEEFFGCTSLIIVPLRDQEFLIGGKRIIYDAVTPDDLETLSILAGQVNIAMENAALYQALRQERDQLQQAKRDLEEWSHILEQKVQERTRKLQETQQQLMQASKLAAIGQLGAGVAHELNNPLGGVLGYTQLAAEQIEQVNDSRLKEHLLRYLRIIEEETQRCKQIIGNLLRFSRGSINEKPVYQTLHIEEVLENTLRLTSHQLEMHRIRLTKEIEPDLPTMNGDSGQLQQVFINIVLNADQAMPKGGELRLIAKRSSEKPAMITIEFQDTGCGIAPEYLDKIFDPFFTTKTIGQGSGLGLSVSYGIIQDHGGQITVKSRLNEGTTFTVYLPVQTGG